MIDARKLAQHEAAFVEPMRQAKVRAEWWFARWNKARFDKDGTMSPLIAAMRSEQAAIDYQLAISREAAARRYHKLPAE
jgi:hypothetical protein